MDVRLSPEQQALRDAAAQVVRRHGPQSVAQLDDPERAAKLDAAVTASGWRELRSPSERGEPWASGVEVAIVAEELAKGLADAAFSGPILAAELRRLAGAETTLSRETVALDRDLHELATGRSQAVAIDVGGAQSALVVYDGVLASVPLPEDALEVDLTRRTVALDTSVSTTSIARRPLAEEQLVRWKAFGQAVTCADLVGVMRGAIELACDYASTRRQYGVHVGSFQSLQHMLADAFVSMEGSRSVALHAAWAVDALDPTSAVAAASLAKAYCSRAARSVCEVAIQVHGGIGNTWDCLAHVYLRRALLSIDLLGGVGTSLAVVLQQEGIGAGDGLR